MASPWLTSCGSTYPRSVSQRVQPSFTWASQPSQECPWSVWADGYAFVPHPISKIHPQDFPFQRSLQHFFAFKKIHGFWAVGVNTRREPYFLDEEGLENFFSCDSVCRKPPFSTRQRVRIRLVTSAVSFAFPRVVLCPRWTYSGPFFKKQRFSSIWALSTCSVLFWYIYRVYSRIFWGRTKPRWNQKLFSNQKITQDKKEWRGHKKNE